MTQTWVIYQTNDYGPSKRNVPDLQATVLIFQLHQSMNESNQHTAGWQTPNGCQKSGVTCETLESSSQSINQSINESIWVTRYLAIPFKMIDGVELIIYMLDWNNKPLKILYYRERIIRQTWLTVSCHSVTGESNESVNKNHSHSSDPFNATT